MKKTFISLFLSLTAIAVSSAQSLLPRAIPEEMGVPSAKIEALFDSLIASPITEIHNAIVIRHGKVIGEMYASPFKAGYGHQLFSCSKTFVSAAVGIAIGDNRLRLDDRLATFFPEMLPAEVSEDLASITVRDLLTMTSGFPVDTHMRSVEDQWIRTYLSHPLVAKSGKKFAYDSIDTYLLSAIVQKVMGKKVVEVLEERIFRNLDITEARWEESPEGINTGGWGLYLNSESLAKMGVLLLNKGNWKGKQLIPADYVEEMGKQQAENPSGDNYCYQTWVCPYPGAFRADGAHGQFILMMPNEDMAVVLTENFNDGGHIIMGHVWKDLMPFVQDEPLPVGKAYRHLQAKQPTYQLPLPVGKRQNKVLQQLSGKTITLEANPMKWKSIRITHDKSGTTLQVVDASGTVADMQLGYKQWLTSQNTQRPLNSHASIRNCFSTLDDNWLSSSAYACTSDAVEVNIHYVNWLSGVVLKISLTDANTAQITAKINFENQPATFVGKVGM